MRYLFFFIIVLILNPAQARVFDFSREKFASYLSYTTGPSAVKKTAYVNEADATYTYSDEIATNVSGEFGFLYSTPKVAFRFGFEFIKPLKISAMTAKNAALSTMYTMDSDLTGYVPKLGLELRLFYNPQSRWFLLLYGGTASLTMTNTYTLSAAGQAAFPAVAAAHSVEATATATSYGASINYEMWLSDNATLVFDLGYQSLLFSSLTYSKAVTTFSGVKAIGDAVKDVALTPRSLDFTYYFGTIGFRIYL